MKSYTSCKSQILNAGIKVPCPAFLLALKVLLGKAYALPSKSYNMFPWLGRILCFPIAKNGQSHVTLVTG